MVGVGLSRLSGFLFKDFEAFFAARQLGFAPKNAIAGAAALVKHRMANGDFFNVFFAPHFINAMLAGV